MSGGRFSLEEAQCEIRSLWGTIEKMNQHIEKLSEDFAKNREVMISINEQVKGIAEMLREVKDNDFTRCAERAVRIRGLEHRVKDLEDAPACKSCKNDQRLTKLEGTNRILRWVAGILAAVLGTIAAKFIWAF